MMNVLQRRHLERFCRKHGLDTAEIDSMISYDENKAHLQSLTYRSLEEILQDRQSREEEYMATHFLTFYVCCILEGAARIEHSAIALSNEFSIRAWTKDL